MKKKKVLFVCIITTLFSITSCNNNAQLTTESLFKDNATTISWENYSKTDEISSYAANVTVYSMNSKKDTELKQTSSYRLTIKNIEDEQFTRIDMSSNFADGRLRSVVSNSKEIAVFDSVTNEVEQRIAISEEEVSKDLSFLQDGIVLGKVNLDKIKETSSRLAFDVNENDESSLLQISIPSSYFNDYEEVKRISTKVVFDVSSETLNSVEIVMQKGEGITVISTVTPVYEEYNDEMIQIGSITVINTENKNLIEGFAEDYSYYNSIDEIEEISLEEYEELKKAGTCFETDVEFGNPADLSNVETIVEVYDSITINETEDSVFKILLEA